MFFLCASLLPYTVNDNGAGLAGLDRVFRVQVCGCSSLQRPWGPAAIISHSFCPLPLSPAPALYTDDGLSEHSQKDTTKDCIVRPCSPWTFSTHTNAHSRCIRTQFYFVFLSSFLCGHIYFLFTLFRSILVLSLSEGECWRNGGLPIVREIIVMSKGDWIDALPTEDQWNTYEIRVYPRRHLRSTPR